MKKEESQQDSDSLPVLDLPTLEAPPAPELPVGADTALFTDDSLLILNAKFMIADAILKLMTRDLRFQDFTRELLMIAMKSVKSEAGTIFEIDHKNQQIFFRAVAGQSSDQVAGFTIPMGQGIVGYVAESRQPMVVANIAENQKHLRAIDKAVGFETRNLVALPMIIRGRIYGVLEVLNRIGETDYTTPDMEILTYFCEMASKAIEMRMMLIWATQAAGNSTGNSGEAA